MKIKLALEKPIRILLTLALSGIYIVSCQLKSEAAAIASTNPAGLVSYWNMDGNVMDSAGGRFSMGGGPFYSGVFGDAVGLDGTSQFIDVGTNEQTFFNDLSPFTLSLWFKTDFPSVQTLFSFDDDTGPYNRTAIYTDSMGIRAGYTNVNGSNTINVGYDINYQSEWTHIALAADPTIARLRLYVNGFEVDSKETGTVSVNHNSIDSGSIGRYHITPGSAAIDALSPPLTGHASYFGGLIDDVAVWNRELTPAEIAAIGVPEPSSLAFLSIGTLVIAGRRRRKQVA